MEIQALVTTGNPGNPRRLVSGLDNQRVAMVLAVLERRGGLPLANREVYVSVIGGFRTEEPACDLAVALAVASSFYDTVAGQSGRLWRDRPDGRDPAGR